jgi:hypothetical protein
MYDIVAMVESDDVKNLVIDIAWRLGLDRAEAANVLELERRKPGRCRIREYRGAGWMANWLVEEGLLVFYQDKDIVYIYQLRGPLGGACQTHPLPAPAPQTGAAAILTA